MSFFKRDPSKKLKKAYGQKLEEAMKAMHRGDIRENSRLVVEAEAIKAQLDKIEADTAGGENP